MSTLLDWAAGHQAILWWLSAVSALMFVGTLIAVPWLVVRMPADYFLHRPSLSELRRVPHPLLRGIGRVLKNVVGVLVLLAGFAMLVLPGQGILTILIGVILLDFPGKFALEQWLIRRPVVHRAINLLRAKANRPPLILPEDDGRGMRGEGTEKGEERRERGES